MSTLFMEPAERSDSPDHSHQVNVSAMVDALDMLNDHLTEEGQAELAADIASAATTRDLRNVRDVVRAWIDTVIVFQTPGAAETIAERDEQSHGHEMDTEEVLEYLKLR